LVKWFLIQLNEGAIKQELGDLVRQSVEDTPNALLDEEADRLTNARRYERTGTRQDTRAGYYNRNLLTKAGNVKLKVPKLRTLPFETAIIQRYQRKEISVEEALVEMYLAGVSVRSVEDITEALWGAKVSAGTVSKLNKKVYVKIEEWRQRELLLKYPYVYLDGIYLKRNWGGNYENVAILVAMAVSEDGQREVIGAAEGMKEDKESWLNFLVSLKERGLDGVRLFVGDKSLGLLEAVNTVFPESKHQRCTVYFYRNVFTVVPRSKVKDVAAMLKAIHAQEDKAAAIEKAKAVVEKLKEMKLKEAAKKVEDSVNETLTYMDFPREHRLKIRSNNVIERLNREIRRRTRVVGAFPDGQSALMLVCARLRYMEDSLWGTKVYLNMNHLDAMDLDHEMSADLTIG
jgi:transposase-like protein